MLTVYGHEKSRAFRVLWMLEELHLDYRHIRLDFGAGEHRNEEFLRLNPSGKVPVLVDGDSVIHESSAILLHIHDGYGQGSELFAESPRQRTEMYQWLFYGSSELEQGLWTAARHSFVLPEERRIPAAVDWGRWEFSCQLDYLSTMLGSRSYVMGDRFGAADILIAQILMWGTQQQRLDLKHENIRAYLTRCMARPAFKGLVQKLKSDKR